jgi:hypothetical protein
MPHYHVDALRTLLAIQSQHERAGHTVQAEQMQRIGDQVAGGMQENEDLREIIHKSAGAIGNGSSCSAEASVEFMSVVSEEIGLAMAALRDELAALKAAAMPVVKRWETERARLIAHGELNHGEDCEYATIVLTSAQLDELARLVGPCWPATWKHIG